MARLYKYDKLASPSPTQKVKPKRKTDSIDSDVCMQDFTDKPDETVVHLNWKAIDKIGNSTLVSEDKISCDLALQTDCVQHKVALMQIIQEKQNNFGGNTAMTMLQSSSKFLRKDNPKLQKILQKLSEELIDIKSVPLLNKQQMNEVRNLIKDENSHGNLEAFNQDSDSQQDKLSQLDIKSPSDIKVDYD